MIGGDGYAHDGSNKLYGVSRNAAPIGWDLSLRQYQDGVLSG
jgi:hypothetical protein